MPRPKYTPQPMTPAAIDLARERNQALEVAATVPVLTRRLVKQLQRDGWPLEAIGRQLGGLTKARIGQIAKGKR